MKIKGDKKPNELVGTDEDDKIQGLGGDDTITAKGGHDTVDGGAGDDKITVAANTSASVDAGNGNDSVKLSAGALASEIDLGKGNDSVDVKESSQSNQTFGIDGGKGDDSVGFALDQDAYTITENGDGAYTVVDANGNSYGLSSISSLTFNGIAFQPGNPENQAPVASTSADQASVEDTPFSFQVAAFSDPDGDALTYSASLTSGGGLPGWLTFDAASRTFSGTPGESDVGAISVRVTASDGSLSSFDDFNITVNSAPIVVPPPPAIVDPVVTGGVLYLDHFYDYDVSESGSMIAVSYAGKNMVFSAASINSVVTVGSSSVDIDTSGWTVRGINGDVNFNNVSFVAADVGPNFKFDASFDFSNMSDISGTVTVNGTTADYFRTAWDYLDEAYTAIQNHGGPGAGNPALFGDYANSTQYGSTTLGAAAFEVNNAFLDLAEDYIAYLEAGGAILTDLVKFTAGSRSQALHDNILGNVNLASLDQRSLDTAGNLARFDDWVNREWVSGNTNSNGQTATLRGVAFDFENDVNRTDYHSFDTEAFDANLTANVQTDPDGTLLNNGTPGEHFHVTTFNAAGISMGLAAHQYRGEYTNYVNGDEYTVNDGRSPLNALRADWSFAMTVQDGLNGSTLDIGNSSTKGDYDVALWIDTNINGGVGGESFQFIVNLEEISDSVTGNGNIFQNSWNFDFNEIKPFLDPAYTDDFVGAATFGIELRLTEVGTGNVVLTNHIDVLVA